MSAIKVYRNCVFDVVSLSSSLHIDNIICIQIYTINIINIHDIKVFMIVRILNQLSLNDLVISFDELIDEIELFVICSIHLASQKFTILAASTHIIHRILNINIVIIFIKFFIILFNIIYNKS